MDLASTQSGPRLSVHSTLGASGAALRTHRNADDDLTSDRHLRELQRFMGAEDGLAAAHVHQHQRCRAPIDHSRSSIAGGHPLLPLNMRLILLAPPGRPYYLARAPCPIIPRPRCSPLSGIAWGPRASPAIRRTWPPGWRIGGGATTERRRPCCRRRAPTRCPTSSASAPKIGRAHVCTPVTNAQPV